MPDENATATQIRPEEKANVPMTDDERRAEHIREHGGRVPTEEDFADVLTPEGNMSGDIVGSDVSESTWASNDSLGGTG